MAATALTKPKCEREKAHHCLPHIVVQEELRILLLQLLPYCANQEQVRYLASFPSQEGRCYADIQKASLANRVRLQGATTSANQTT